jgi:hypothetical protein
MLASFMELLKGQHLSGLNTTTEYEDKSLASGHSSVPSDTANHRGQMSLASGSTETAGSGS